MKLKNDSRLRKQLFVEDAMSHPAKGHIGMWQAMIEMYTEPGQWVLDPMAGIGTTLVAALMGRNVICNEMEQHFLEPMVASWAKMKQQPMLGYELGQVLIVRGDARHLPLSSADAVITSPPYEGSLQGGDPEGARQRKAERYERGEFTALRPDVFTSPTNNAWKGISGGYTRPVDAVISSPPYANRLADTYVDDDLQRMSYEMGKAKIDSIVTSPPYADQVASPSHGIDMGKRGRGEGGVYFNTPFEYGKGENIGNQKGDAYWDSMKAVYSECHRVLKPGGVMALVLKGLTRDGQYIDLPQQTAEMVESLGFTKFDEWTRELWSLSFWRILQQRRDPEAFDDRLKFEYVLAFRKDGGEGNGVDSVITSPPWEESSAAGHDNNTDWFDKHPEIAKRGGGTVRNKYRTGYTRKGAP